MQQQTKVMMKDERDDKTVVLRGREVNGEVKKKEQKDAGGQTPNQSMDP